MKNIGRKIGKACRILATAISVTVAIFLCLAWFGYMPFYFTVFAYAIFALVFHALSMIFSTDDTAERRCAMKKDKRQFVEFVTKHFYATIEELQAIWLQFKIGTY